MPGSRFEPCASLFAAWRNVLVTRGEHDLRKS